MKRMTYEETMEWIDQAGKTGIHLGLERMTDLIGRMDHPERELKIIHVAGTNGKGSVCTVIGAILETAGYKVGRYISPTLYDYRERIQVNGQWIQKEELAEGMSGIREVCEKMAEDHLESPTIFEIETALAFWYFKKMACDYVILETGMGGRLDSTNVIESPVLTVITSVSMDHTAQLGDTLEAIAGEKAGILKPGIPAIVYPQNPEVMAVFKKTCEAKGCPLIVMDPSEIHVGDRKLFKDETSLEPIQKFDYKGLKDLEIHLGGVYQVNNGALAIEAVEQLSLEPITEAVIRRGISSARWSGRFECLSKKPLIFIDGAHNPEGAESLRETIETWMPEKKRVLVMGVFADKDYLGILKRMAPVSDTLVCFTPENQRGLDSGILAKAAEPFFDNVLDGGFAQGALNLASVWAGSNSAIIIFGSLSTISTMCDIIKR